MAPSIVTFAHFVAPRKRWVHVHENAGEIATLTASRLQLAADCRGLRKKELKTGYYRSNIF
jgi:hypothetical protein